MKIDVNSCVKEIKEKLHNPADLKERNVQFFSTDITILYFADLVNSKIIDDNIVQTITETKKGNAKDLVSLFNKKILAGAEIVESESILEITEKLLKGFAAVIIDKQSQVLCVEAERITVRSINVPPNSIVIKGPRQGFNESIKYNMALIRQRLATDKLVMKSLSIGKLTKTQCAICYIDKVASKKVVNEVERRLSKIDVDGILDSSYLATFLMRNPNSLFKQIGDTEKPDILCAKLLEGRVAILVDGTPIALTVPFILLEDLQNDDDYYNQPIRITFVRILRLIGIILAILLPGVYVALQLYHYKIIPIQFLVTIMNTTQGIPFTPFTELIFVVLLFEILYEANLRMPQYLGLAISIVGALILGDTAVNAGLVSPPAVMIVALSGLTFYVVPNQASQFAMLRLIFILSGAVLGLFGIIIGSVWLISYLCSFDSFDSPYFAPLSPFINNDQKDFLIKRDFTKMTTRPKSIPNNRNNLHRMKPKKKK